MDKFKQSVFKKLNVLEQMWEFSSNTFDTFLLDVKIEMLYSVLDNIDCTKEYKTWRTKYCPGDVA